ncbi:MAG: hypothetical protein QXT63_07410 [Thermoplasmata archaeon]
MDGKKIILTIEELKMWIHRREELEKELKRLPGHERALRKGELVKIEQQIEYYSKLVRDMKQTVRPAGLSSFLGSLFLTK